MPTLASKLNVRSEEFKANAAAMRAPGDDPNAQLERVEQVAHIDGGFTAWKDRGAPVAEKAKKV